MKPLLLTAIVERNPIYRAGLAYTLRKAGFKPLLCVDTVAELSSARIDATDPMLLIDAEGNEEAIGRITEDLRRTFPESRVVYITDQTDRVLLHAYEFGADGIISKPTGCEELIKSLELVALGHRVFPVEVLSRLISERFNAEPPEPRSGDPFKKLSAREMEILNSLSMGSPNKVIARQFGITEATVKVHVKAILRKLPARNRTEAAILARRHSSSAQPE